MTISYNWLHDYLPVKIDPEKLSDILTSVGLEVESMEKTEEIKGGLQGLVVGEVINCEKHPDADKLKITKVNIGQDTLQIVCGAPNVAVGQKVIVATIGTTIYPVDGSSLTMKKAKIRGVESYGMICAEDEIGLGKSHEGIFILPADSDIGSSVTDYFKPKSDIIYEIGLTPNRMDAMSHLGVAKDVCAWYSHHHKTEVSVNNPQNKSSSFENVTSTHFPVKIAEPSLSPRYSGICISGVKVAASPKWLSDRLLSIGQKPINNIVDITNFILHESGQPLHAFNLNETINKGIIVRQLAEGTDFITLDGKERKLNQEDIIICDADENPLCLGGVFGGLTSGVNDSTSSIFLESANFNPELIRKTSLRHNLRTDAAIRFEKGVDITKTVEVLKRAAGLIIEIAGGQISSDLIDIYPNIPSKKVVDLSWNYLKKLSGKEYRPDAVKSILQSLGFEMQSLNENAITVLVPFTNPDITLPADIVEEIMRIDGLDNVEIPKVISIAPSTEKLAYNNSLREKVSSYLIGNGFAEILTNSITNSSYYSETELSGTVKIINSLSVELDVMKPQMLQTALECIAYNLNRKNNELFLFEFGKTYSIREGQYKEHDHLTIYISGSNSKSWKNASIQKDLFYLKGVCESICEIAGLPPINYLETLNPLISPALEVKSKNISLGILGNVSKDYLNKFSLKQPVIMIDINWGDFIRQSKKKKIIFQEIPKFQSVIRELSIVVDRDVKYENLLKATEKAALQKLVSTRLLNIFESDKLGKEKKSFALRYTFLDTEKTMTDIETDKMMTHLMDVYESQLNAQIRRG